MYMRNQLLVVEEFAKAQTDLPFTIAGTDPGNGSELINEVVSGTVRNWNMSRPDLVLIAKLIRHGLSRKMNLSFGA